ncbi:pyrroline-5-carboxylate reductase [Apilactobacillus apisilvae]|uniref:Pyrroline-5-carboxylate reductase n=1 Tax=Apilactobacillus apisilvae TaxID=2923364 RepID=A0ABY4PGZ2_9LACO|nr:pyrroline-5-carboxylate reductase [Apilactobacillus apisilvae]UQS85019.1 pyrroline-5-carboxylate reductase [Apilactobacillus apisilvae]
MKIGFIGVGSMAKAMIRGFIKSNQVKPRDIFVHSKHAENYKNFSKDYDLNAMDSNEEVIDSSDYIILAINPDDVIDVLKNVRDLLDNKVLISIVWDYDLQRLEELTNYDLPIMRMVPNVNVEENSGSIAYNYNNNLQDNQLSSTINTFKLLGKMIKVSEDKINIAGSLVGCTPAYAYLFVEAFSQIAVKYGINKKDANVMLTQAVKGSMETISKSSLSTSDLIDNVCSPGGSTVKGLLALKENGFENAIMKCFDATQGRH